MDKLLGVPLLLAVLAGQAQGHFLFLKPGKDGRAEAVFSDTLDPDRADLLAKFKDARFSVVGGKGLEAEADGGVLRTASAGKKPAWVVGVCPYGVVDKGKVPFKLAYFARTLVNGTPSDLPAEAAKALALDVVPVLKDGKVAAVRVLWQGKPLARAEVLHQPPGGKGGWITKTTDERGEAAITGGLAGLHAVRAKHVVKAKGRSAGKRYDEERSYATLAFPAK